LHKRSDLHMSPAFSHEVGFCTSGRVETKALAGLGLMERPEVLHTRSDLHMRSDLAHEVGCCT
jgi:hypothetical protein